MCGSVQIQERLSDLAGPAVRVGFRAELERAARALSADETPLRVVLAHIDGEGSLRERQRVVVATDRRLMLIPVADGEVDTVLYNEITEVSGRRMFLAGYVRDFATLGSFLGLLSPAIELRLGGKRMTLTRLTSRKAPSLLDLLYERTGRGIPR
jgi:hypothetical protein